VQVRFRLPPFADSPLARLDGRWRLAALLALVLAAAAVRHPLPAALALLASLLVAVTALVPPGWLLSRLAAVSLLIALFAVPLAVFGRPSEAVVVALKGLSLALLAAALVVSAPLERTARAAWHLGVPGVVVHVGLLAYRYLFLLGDELERLRVALRVRGFRNRADRHSYDTVAAATGTLLARGADRAERVAAAMRCRGFDGTFRSLDDDHTRPADVLALIAAVLVAASLVLADRYNDPAPPKRDPEVSRADLDRRGGRPGGRPAARLPAGPIDVAAAGRGAA
jgi:cobalt/nickel transport system permease protein